MRKTLVAAALIVVAFSAPAYAGHGWHGGNGYGWHGGNGYGWHGDSWGAGLLGFGIGAVVGSALAPSTVYVAPAPAYGPPPWSPAWYSYCRQVHGPYFNPNTGYFQAADGGWYFCR
jgi:Spy/CpxP family protein refolding chaperone